MAISREKRTPTRLSRPCLNCCLVDTKREHAYPHKWRINTIPKHRCSTKKASITVIFLHNGRLFSQELYWGPFLERPGNFPGPKANFKIQTTWIVAQFLAHKPVNFASSTDSFIVLFCKLLKLCSWMQTQQTPNSFPGPKSYRNFRETGP